MRIKTRRGFGFALSAVLAALLATSTLPAYANESQPVLQNESGSEAIAPSAAQAESGSEPLSPLTAQAEINVPSGDTLVLASPTAFYFDSNPTGTAGEYDAGTKITCAGTFELRVIADNAVVRNVVGPSVISGGGHLTIRDSNTGYFSGLAASAVTIADNTTVSIDYTSWVSAISATELTVESGSSLSVTSSSLLLSGTDLTVKGSLTLTGMGASSNVDLKNSLVVDGGTLNVSSPASRSISLVGYGNDALVKIVNGGFASIANTGSGNPIALEADDIVVDGASTLSIDSARAINAVNDISVTDRSKLLINQTFTGTGDVGINVQGALFTVDGNSIVEIGTESATTLETALETNGSFGSGSPAKLSVTDGSTFKAYGTTYGIHGAFDENEIFVSASTLIADGSSGYGIRTTGSTGAFNAEDGADVTASGLSSGICIDDGTVSATGSATSVIATATETDGNEFSAGIYASGNVTAHSSATIDAAGTAGQGICSYGTVGATFEGTIKAASDSSLAIDSDFIYADNGTFDAYSRQQSAISAYYGADAENGSSITAKTESEGCCALWVPEGDVIIRASDVELYAVNWSATHGALYVPNGTIDATDASTVAENYLVPLTISQDSFVIPFDGITTRTDYDNYEYAGTPTCSIEKDGSGSKQGVTTSTTATDITLIATRTGDVGSECVTLCPTSTHIIRTTPVTLVSENEPARPNKSLNVARLFGDDRYGTSEQVSTYERVAADEDVIIVAAGNDYHFPDSLAASSLSGIEGNAPIVLTDKYALSDETRRVINDTLSAGKVIIVGNEHAVSDEVEAQIAALPSVSEVERIGGVDRQETAELIYSERLGNHSSTAIIARCGLFADSLSISPWAAATHSPIFLTEFGETSLTQETQDALAAGDFDRVVIVGDAYAVSARAAEEARIAAGVPYSQVVRLGGIDRFDTSSLIAAWTTSADRSNGDRLTWEKPAITRGDLHADALTGGALQGRDRSPILLTTTGAPHEAVLPHIASHDGDIAEIRFFGDHYSIGHETIKGFVSVLTYDTLVWRPDESVAIDLS